MSRCALVFQSIHHVLAAEALLKDAGLEIDVIPVPREVSPNCGMAVEFVCEQKADVLGAVADLEDRIVGAYRLKGRFFLKME